MKAFNRNRPRRGRRSRQQDVYAPLPQETKLTTTNSVTQPSAFHNTVDLRGSKAVVPSRVRVVLPYHEVLNRNPGLALQDYLFNANSIYDPDRTGTGHQPLGHDQWAAFYGDYRVFRVDVEINIVNNSTAPLGVAVACTNSIVALDAESGAEQPFSKQVVVGGTTGTSARKIVATFNLHDIVGRSQSQYMADNLQYAAAFGTSPNETILIHVMAHSYDGSNIVFALDVKLRYHVELYDPLELSVS